MSTLIMRLGSRLPQILALLALTGCAATRSAGVAGRTSGDSALDFYPLYPGWGWAYDLERDGVEVLALYSVAERVHPVVVVRNGDERIEYLLLPDGIARGAGRVPGDYLLKNPVRAGTAWSLGAGEAKVVAAGQDVTLVSGTHRDCATVEEVRRDPERVTRTTYCRDTGPVAIEVLVYDPTKKSYETMARARLRSVTRPEDAAAGD